MSTDTRHCTRSVNRDQRLSCVEPATIYHCCDTAIVPAKLWDRNKEKHVVRQCSGWWQGFSFACYQSTNWSAGSVFLEKGFLPGGVVWEEVPLCFHEGLLWHHHKIQWNHANLQEGQHSGHYSNSNPTSLIDNNSGTWRESMSRQWTASRRIWGILKTSTKIYMPSHLPWASCRPSFLSSKDCIQYQSCNFCGLIKSNMTMHLMSAHKKEERIVEISAMNQKERLQALAVLRTPTKAGNDQVKYADHCWRRKIWRFCAWKEIDWPESDVFRMQWSVQEEPVLQACKGMPGRCYNSLANCHQEEPVLQACKGMPGRCYNSLANYHQEEPVLQACKDMPGRCYNSSANCHQEEPVLQACKDMPGRCYNSSANYHQEEPVLQACKDMPGRCYNSSANCHQEEPVLQACKGMPGRCYNSSANCHQEEPVLQACKGMPGRCYNSSANCHQEEPVLQACKDMPGRCYNSSANCHQEEPVLQACKGMPGRCDNSSANCHQEEPVLQACKDMPGRCYNSSANCYHCQYHSIYPGQRMGQGLAKYG